ncbi:MAG: Imm32 family immunity protein [Gemmatimonadota bacterium]|nr:Imm32 family immunity protein [Gemmatimonadota bacterium]
MLTVEVSPSKECNTSDWKIAEVAVCFDEEGLELLEYRLKLLRQGKVPNHDHLMTPSWSGYELTEEKQGDDRNILVNHLRLVRR